MVESFHAPLLDGQEFQRASRLCQSQVESSSRYPQISLRERGGSQFECWGSIRSSE